MKRPHRAAINHHYTEDIARVKITQTSLLLATLLFVSPLFANQWVAVDCAGQARALLNQVGADSALELTEDQAERLRAISISVCEGDSAAQSESGKQKKKKGFFDSLSFGEDGEKKEKKGNERLNKF